LVDILIENGFLLTMKGEGVGAIEEAQRAAEEVTSKAAEDYYKADSLLAKTMKKGLL
jgi:hypothetical protein